MFTPAPMNRMPTPQISDVTADICEWPYLRAAHAHEHCTCTNPHTHLRTLAVVQPTSSAGDLNIQPQPQLPPQLHEQLSGRRLQLPGTLFGLARTKFAPHLRNYLIALRALLHYASEHSDNYSYSVDTLSHRHKYSYEKIRTIRARGESRMH